MSQEVQTDAFRPTAEVRTARDAVVASLAQVEAGQRDGLEELRVALCGYVGVLRREGLASDAVLAMVRELVQQPASPGGAISLTPIVREALAELTLEWCRAEYARAELA